MNSITLEELLSSSKEIIKGSTPNVPFERRIATNERSSEGSLSNKIFKEASSSRIFKRRNDEEASSNRIFE